MESAPDFYFDSVSQVKMDRWSSGRCALLGDAAHCASPLSGLGIGMAVVGAYILAGELAEADGDYLRRKEGIVVNPA
jgi:2-polyprenyl-6-methoxyphenol hydroxylase-like FAD-dependent oxidoreductase